MDRGLCGEGVTSVTSSEHRLHGLVADIASLCNLSGGKYIELLKDNPKEVGRLLKRCLQGVSGSIPAF